MYVPLMERKRNTLQDINLQIHSSFPFELFLVLPWLPYFNVRTISCVFSASHDTPTAPTQASIRQKLAELALYCARQINSYHDSDARPEFIKPV